MTNLKKILLFAWVLIFGITACSQRGAQEQVLDGDKELEGQSYNKNESEIPMSPSLPDTQNARNYDELEIVTLLPRDGIPAIDNPVFLSAEEADKEYAPDELVIGVNYEGDARAYSIPYLSRHEIVNDTVGGKKIAVTW